MMKSAVFPGSFDPFTIGHEHMVHEALKWVDELWILVGVNPAKVGWMIPEQRVAAISKLFEENPKVRVTSHVGLLTDWMESQRVFQIIKGLRGAQDWEHEASMAFHNQQLLPQSTTVFLPGNPALQFVSSSAVRQLCTLGQDVSQWVPAPILTYLPHSQTDSLLR